jgi:D-sedoheptulose 7-phosphate isomerase
MDDLVAKVRRSARETAQTQEAFFEKNGESIVACARALDTAFAAGGRLYTLGNGGSACDAQHAAVEFSHPVFEKRAAIPAFALPSDVAFITALGNDRDFTTAFADQLRVLGKKGDVALALSTSGKSASVLRALSAAREIGMITVGLTGRDGGKIPSLCDHSFVVESFSIHRIQETHITLLHVLWDLIHVVRGHEDTVA